MNLLFVMTDHQRADSLGMVQAGVKVTPNLNRLAARGTNFERAYTTCPLCVPARTALATGKYPTKNGVITNDWKGESAGDHTTLHEHLHRAGYEVAHIGVDHIRVKPDLQTRFSFARWNGNENHAEHLRSIGINETQSELRRFKRPIQENHGGAMVECLYSNTRNETWPGDAKDFKDLYWCHEAIDYLHQEHDKPFALFLYLWAPHPPLRVPEPYASLFDPNEIDLPENVGCPSEGEPSNYRDGIAARLAEGIARDEWKYVWAAHLGLINMADAGIGSVIDALEETGQLDDTLTVFTVDHGDHLGQHAMYQKMEMYEQAIRVPFIVSGPNVTTQTVDAPVSHLDIMPSVLDLLNLDTPGDLDGHSLRPTLVEGAAPSDRPVFSQYSGNPHIGDVRRCVISGQYKCTWTPPDEFELYDLEKDPLEMNNLADAPEHEEGLRDLYQKMCEWAAAHGDPVFTD